MVELLCTGGEADVKVVLTLSERVQRQAGLSWLDGEQPLSLKVEEMLLLNLLDL